MQLRAIFDNQVALSNVVMTAGQLSSAFVKVCNIFFSKVRPIYVVVTDEILYEGYQDLTDVLGLGVGTFTIVGLYQFEETRIKIMPINFEAFDLNYPYVADFEMIVKIVTDEVGIENMNMLKGSGIDSVESPQIVPLVEFLSEMSKKYSIETGRTIL